MSDAVYSAVRRIPPGRVATYGQVADLVEGLSVSAREVGAILNVSPPDVPWQRVVGSGGHLPIGKRSPALKDRQRRMLEAEGVLFLANGCVDMAQFQLRMDSDSSPGLFD